MGSPLPMPPKFGPPKSNKSGKPTTGVGSGGGGGGGGSPKANPGAKPAAGPGVAVAPWYKGTGTSTKGGAGFLKDLVNVGANLLNPVIDAVNSGYDPATGTSTGGSGGRRSGGGGGGGGGGMLAAALPQIPDFVDPYAALRSTLQGHYLGNGVDNQGVQAYLAKITQEAAAKTQGYSQDAAAQSKQAGADIASHLAQSEAARKAAVAAQMNDLIAQGGAASASRLAATGAQGQAQLAGQSQGAATTTSRMADIFNQQSADRLAGVQNTGQYAEGQAQNNYQKMMAQLDMSTAQAKQAYDQMVAGIQSGAASGGGGGRSSGRRGGGGGGSSSSGQGSYQDTQTRTLTNNQTNTATSEDMAAMAQSQVWNSMSPSDRAAVQSINTYLRDPNLAQAYGIDINKIAKSNPQAISFWWQQQGNDYGYPYSKSTDTSSQQQYNRDSSVQTSKYTSPKVKGGPPPAPGGGIKRVQLW